MLDSLEPDRRKTLSFSEHGLGDGNTFGFWPMLIGGSFLYMSYYGCDQSQVQRLRASGACPVPRAWKRTVEKQRQKGRSGAGHP